MKKYLTILGVVVIALGIGLGITNCFKNKEETEDNSSDHVITSGCLKASFSNSENIGLKEASPITDKRGMLMSPNNFTISNTCNTDSRYIVKFKLSEESNMDVNYVKVAINDRIVMLSSLNYVDDSYILDTGVLTKTINNELDDSQGKKYAIRVWMDFDAPNSQVLTELIGKIIVDQVPSE